MSNCGFELHFPKDLEHLFMCLSATLFSSLEKISIQTYEKNFFVISALYIVGTDTEAEGFFFPLQPYGFFFTFFF